MDILTPSGATTASWRTPAPTSNRSSPRWWCGPRTRARGTRTPSRKCVASSGCTSGSARATGPSRSRPATTSRRVRCLRKEGNYEDEPTPCQGGIAGSCALGLDDGASGRPEKNPERNVYFGEQHVHTSWSFDAFAFGDSTCSMRSRS
ncbi:MAG: DUF3604 domain-containing protein [Deltaproteobacteria bacterium]|nr:MAG: DUF3604 domain-containing protein [Deltaproteobacteria bacterium]